MVPRAAPQEGRQEEGEIRSWRVGSASGGSLERDRSATCGLGQHREARQNLSLALSVPMERQSCLHGQDRLAETRLQCNSLEARSAVVDCILPLAGHSEAQLRLGCRLAGSVRDSCHDLNNRRVEEILVERRDLGPRALDAQESGFGILLG